jgi:type IV pilus assembly protein PilA
VTASPSRTIARGFTLLEVMIAVGIIGVLSSIAVPTLHRVMLRAKAAERHEVMLHIKKAVVDLYLRNGSVAPRGGSIASGLQPPTIPGIMKLVPDWRAPGFDEIFRSSHEILGATYYSYSFIATEPDDGSEPTLEITAIGDLDGDGMPSTKWIRFYRVGGVYQVKDPALDEVPIAGAEDQVTF